MNWFERHLNWTWMLSYLISIVTAFIVMFIALLVYPDITEDTLNFLGVMIIIGVLVAASIWVIHKKGRSLWWLLLANWLSPLWLTNLRNQSIQEPNITSNAQGFDSSLRIADIKHGEQFCIQCGMKLGSEGRFCPKCGMEKSALQQDD